MPADREVQYHRSLDGLTVRVEPIDSKDIYFTDEDPEFDLIVENGLDRPVITREEEGIIWVLGVGQDAPDPEYAQSIEIDLEPGEIQKHRIGGELLAYEGNGVIGINRGSTLYGGADADTVIIEAQDPSLGGYRWLYTFTVWDESHYNAIHEQPQKLLRWSLIMSLGVLIAALVTAAVGIVRIALALGWV